MAICRRLRAELGEAVFTSWFARLELESIADDVAHLSVPTKFLKNWIQMHYSERIFAAVAGEFSNVKQIIIGVRSSSRPMNLRPAEQERVPEFAASFDTRVAPKASPDPQRFSAPQANGKARTSMRDSDGEVLAGSPLDRRLNFSTFLVGRSNQLAYASAQEVAFAQQGEALRFNPLYIHASVGLGKTHLLQAIAHAATAAKRRVIYLTAEKFMHGFVCALKAETAIAFKEKLRGIDILIIDDVQFLQGKSIQQEFCHTLNALIDARRQIVIAADRPPGELESLDERVRSRFAGGLCVEMGALDETLRIKMLEARVAAAKLLHPNFEMSPAVLAYVANAIQTNGRDLDGAVNRLVAHASLNGAAALRRDGGSGDPRSRPHARAETGQDRGHSEARREPLQRHQRRHPVGAPNRQCGAAAPDRHVSGKDADAALAAGDRPALWRQRSHDRAARGPQDRGARRHGRDDSPRRSIFLKRMLTEN